MVLNVLLAEVERAADTPRGTGIGAFIFLAFTVAFKIRFILANDNLRQANILKSLARPTGIEPVFQP